MLREGKITKISTTVNVGIT
ncbi:unnamed protein product [Tuber melanosporum]|uniref:(Perigord truffle) hypothetical protein n=1 Tax=Tuber melanosporum (strain Mel28) TaxID=656061 RepID=D5GAG9_TUBMM|nr:unnamed protein product [Tuber melanosporum]